METPFKFRKTVSWFERGEHWAMATRRISRCGTNHTASFTAKANEVARSARNAKPRRK